MKKLTFGLITTLLFVGVGTAAFAQDDNGGIINFESMKPYIEKMHPSFSEKQLEDMYDNCHGENGMMKNVDVEDMQKRMSDRF